MTEVAAYLKTRRTMHWINIVAGLILCAALVTSASRALTFRIEITQSLCVLVIAASLYAWVTYPTGSNVFLSVVIFLCLLWVWAAREMGVLGLYLGAFAILLGFAIWRSRKRSRLVQHMQQVLADLGEEKVVKDQATVLAGHVSDAMCKKLSRNTQLQSIAEELSNMTDMGGIAQLAVDRAFSLIGKSDVCLLFLVDRERQELSLFASKKRESIASVRAKHGDQFDRYVLRTHKPLLVNDARKDFRFTVVVSPERSISSVIACPLTLGGTPEGVLRLDSSHPGAYTQDDLRFLDILLDLVTTAMTNARLFAEAQLLSITDGLTGLMLRRPFQEQLTREVLRASRNREAASVLMIDVDHFKEYNDTHGHTAGDLILKSVADVLRTVAPSDAALARYGGEEFAILLPRLNRHQASDVAEQIRRFVEKHIKADVSGHTKSARDAPLPIRRVGEAAKRERTGQLTQSPQSTGVTVSIGVSSFPDDAQAELELIRVADQRLYAAKHAGRNLVICA